MPREEIQAIWFDKKAGWSVPTAKIWIAQHGFRLLRGKKIHIIGDQIRFRIRDPAQFSHFTTKVLPGSVYLVLGWYGQ